MERIPGRPAKQQVRVRTVVTLISSAAVLSVLTGVAGTTYQAQAVGTVPGPPASAGAAATPVNPPPARTGRIVAATPSDALQKVQALADGDILELADGTYQGLYRVTANDTTVRPAPNQTPVFTGDGRFVLEGRNTLVNGLTFTSQIAPILELQGSGQIVSGNTFVGAGDGRDGSSVGLITIRNPTPGWEGSAGPDGLNPPLVTTRHRVEGNTFLQPRNTVYWQSHGVLHNVFTHNTVQGPHGISGRETMAVKLGFGFGAEDTFTEVSYNTINDWTAWPYVIGVKSSATRITNNLLSKGRLQIRYGHRNQVIGNVILDGDIHAGGDANVISDNYVRTVNPVDDFGPLALFGRSGLVNSVGDYSGTNGRPPFIMEFSNGQVSGNTLISAANDIGTIVNVWYDDAILAFPMRTTTFSRNTLYRNSATGFLATSRRNWEPTGPLNDQTFIDNTFHCPDTCDVSQLPGNGTTPSAAPAPTTTAPTTGPTATSAAGVPTTTNPETTGATTSSVTTSSVTTSSVTTTSATTSSVTTTGATTSSVTTPVVALPQSSAPTTPTAAAPPATDTLQPLNVESFIVQLDPPASGSGAVTPLVRASPQVLAPTPEPATTAPSGAATPQSPEETTVATSSVTTTVSTVSSTTTVTPTTAPPAELALRRPALGTPAKAKPAKPKTRPAKAKAAGRSAAAKRNGTSSTKPSRSESAPPKRRSKPAVVGRSATVKTTKQPAFVNDQIPTRTTPTIPLFAPKLSSGITR